MAEIRQSKVNKTLILSTRHICSVTPITSAHVLGHMCWADGCRKSSSHGAEPFVLFREDLYIGPLVDWTTLKSIIDIRSTAMLDAQWYNQ